ncbi:MAG: hypothetical protein JXQ66_04325 [Campylobacterales bacterium]|nr:hypothetical protein [Campylobacterales bacterium]
MAKIDKIKETLNSLRVGLSIISALLITLGGTLGSLYKKDEIDILFWVSTILFFGFLIVGFVTIHKIRIKTDELEDL